MKDLVKSALTVIGAAVTAGALVSAAVVHSTPELPHPEKVMAIDAHLGVDGCLIEYWQIPYKYKTINRYLRDFPDAKPVTTATEACVMNGLPTDIPDSETFEAYDYPVFDYPVVGL